ncbi:MAG: InlB B-repeat-containing protein, partial [Clostridia bacterium]|nr:InlB B-repeat-containing protein [Clostridia bacterium]
GGTLDPMVTSYKYGDAITLATPTKPGFTFGGWYSNSSYRTTSSKINATDTGDKNFYAKWTSSAPTIEFGSVGEDGKTVNAYFSSSKETDVIIGVLYDGTAVKEIKTAAATATNWAANTVYAKDIKFDNNVNNYDLKLFLWDGIGTAKPLAATPGKHKKAANYRQIWTRSVRVHIFCDFFKFKRLFQNLVVRKPKLFSCNQPVQLLALCFNFCHYNPPS